MMVKLIFGSKTDEGEKGMLIGFRIKSENNEIADYSKAKHISAANTTSAEFNALIEGLRYLTDQGYTGAVEACGNCQITVNQINGVWSCPSMDVEILLSITQQLMHRFDSCAVKWISQEQGNTI